jgi:hypothetical protein
MCCMSLSTPNAAAGRGCGSPTTSMEFPFGSTGQRLDRLEEACQIIRGLRGLERLPVTY